MATLVLQSAGSLVGGWIGGPLGAMAGRALGTAMGSSIDRQIFGGSRRSDDRTIEGPRLSDLDGLISLEGAPIPRIYGRARLGGQLIWATRFEEEVQTSTTRGSRHGGKFAPQAPGITATSYAYYGNFAIGICEGPIAYVRRIWTEGRELDRSQFILRIYQGTNEQMPDPLIIAKEGQDNAPAYRGLAYVVFEHFPLGNFGNRIPQISFEVIRPVSKLASYIQTMTLIPGAGEFVYATQPVYQVLGPGRTSIENRHQRVSYTNVHAAIDALQGICPNLRTISLVVTWFGDDLRAEVCTISPRVEEAQKATESQQWSVSGIKRWQGRVVTRVNGRPAYGGTPSDLSVIELIQELKRRGLRVILYPFVMMDIPSANTLPNPLGSGVQPPYPWRGRITSRSNAYSATAAFFGQAQAHHFFKNGQDLGYHGPLEWSFRRLILHYAHLAKEAGGVEGFILASEYVGLTHLRGSEGSYPAVSHFVSLARDVKGILGPDSDVIYAADWTEYGAHVYNGGRDVDFPLDPLWESPDISAIGIDFYAPLSDWRDDDTHVDQEIASSIYDRSYLQKHVHSGEGFDWCYATDGDRMAQKRQSIQDSTCGKPWVYRVKDIAGWWCNPHPIRRNGQEVGQTAYRPCAKPIWLTEIGIPAVDKGTNGPHIFPDFKSSDAGFPIFSSKERDDLIQIRGLEAIYDAFSSEDPIHNPFSPIYGAPMIEAKNLFVWTWDARPFPTFPDLSSLWGDADHWLTGHWVTGRLEGAPLDGIITHVLKDYQVDLPISIDVDGFVDGYVIDRPMSVRTALEPLLSVFDAQASVRQGVVSFYNGYRPKPKHYLNKDLYIPLNERGELIGYSQIQASKLPYEIHLYFTDSDRAYRRTSTFSRRLLHGSQREESLHLAACLSFREAQKRADISLQALWVAREHIVFALSYTYDHLCVGDLIYVTLADSKPRLFRISKITDSGLVRWCSAMAVLSHRDTRFAVTASSIIQKPPIFEPPLMPGKPQAVVLDLSLGAYYPLQYLALFSDPWPGRLAVWRSLDQVHYKLYAAAEVPAMIGETRNSFQPGPLWRWDMGTYLDVYFPHGNVHSVSDSEALSGGNKFALCGDNGIWEIFTAARSSLIAPCTYRLSRFLRGLGGNEHAARRTIPPGATVVLLDEALIPLAKDIGEVGQTWHYRIVPAYEDYSSASAVVLQSTISPLGIKPYAPVHIRGHRMASGIRIYGVRQSRLGGENWNLVNPPLGEDSEHYMLHILKEDVVCCRLESKTPGFLYPKDAELRDFGLYQTSLWVKMCQVSSVVGPGFWQHKKLIIV